jgi:hypothetical protein
MRAGGARSRLAAVGTTLALVVITATAFASGSAWETIRDEGGIRVSRKVVEGSPFVAFRGEGDVRAPLLAVAEVLVDVPHDTEWLDSVREARILRKRSDTEYVMYSHLATPVPLTDRELVADVSLTVDPSRQGLRVDMHSVDDPAAPRTSYVRAALEESSFTLRANADGTTHVTAEIHCDPRGSVPAWVVNYFQRNWGMRTLQRLRAQVARGDAPPQPILRDRLAGGG